ncbi:uncharacterized protein [Lepeophtheirus salmonis]|uniref:uncharacterized protein n=1 Tax=Lepeophtheirus salmonis TaxID=72036 RepID=UPI003AF35352
MIPFQDMILFGDGESKLSFLSTATGETLHLLPNILIGTGRYCRACKYHDKGIDNMFLTDNGYLITGSSGSKYVKIWKFNTSHTEDWEGTDVKELQILRDHDDYITALRVYENKIYSSCSDGKIYIHEFPQGQQHYDMAEEEETDLVNVVSLSSNGTLSEAPKNPTELCLGGFRCRTGKTGITKSSSSFMVSFQLRPAVAEVKESIRLSTIIIPEEPDEWNPDSDYDSDEYELVLETESDTDEDDKMEGQD